MKVLHGTYEIAGQGMVLAEGLRAMAGCTDDRYRELSAAAAALAAGRYRESTVIDRLALLPSLSVP